MRIPSSVFAVGRYALALGVIAGSVALFSATKKTEFTIHDKAYYADPNTVNFVRAGFNITIKSAAIAADGTMSVNYSLTDLKGQPLDIAGLVTPGAVSVSFLAAYIPQGQTEFWSYITRGQTSPITKVTALQASGESLTTGTNVPESAGQIGNYIYTFKQKAVAQGGGAWDKTATHRIGIYGSRNLSEFDLGTFYDDTVISWVPGGGAAKPRDVVRTGACNACHGTGSDSGLAAHGGNRKTVELCDMCHTEQTIDPDTGNSMSMKIMIHKIHTGKDLPSVIAGTPYQIIGHGQSVADYSTVGYPANGGTANCTTCHDPAQGATQQAAYLTNPSRSACGSCHDTVNFATGANHVNLPQVSDKQCSSCHQAVQGDLEFDASIPGAHVIPNKSASIPGIVVKILKVDTGTPGNAPLVTFTAKDKTGANVPMSKLTTALRFVLSGPTTDYGSSNFGSDVTTAGYVSETAGAKATCDSGGTCTYQFTHKIPADAKGTFVIGSEARLSAVLMPGTAKQQSVNYGATNDVFYFSVDGSPVAARRKIVDIAKCDTCHDYLSLHGANRNDNIDYCVVCHNPKNTDINVRAVAKDPADKAAPAQSVNMAYMIHRIHTGEELKALGTSYTVVGNGGSHNPFDEVRYPVMGKTGSTFYTQACYMCHVNGSEAVLPIGKNTVVNPQSPLSPAGATTSACTACHPANSTFAHSLQNTNTQFGESCDVCHGAGKDFDVVKMHAGK